MNERDAVEDTVDQMSLGSDTDSEIQAIIADLESDDIAQIEARRPVAVSIYLCNMCDDFYY